MLVSINSAPRATAASLIVAAVLLLPTGAAADIRWQSDLGRARAESLKTGRPILLDFWATWCGPCNTMDAEVFSLEQVGVAMRKVLPVRVDIDRQQVLARDYGVSGTPTLIVIDGYGNELFRHGGLLAADRLIPLLEALPADLHRVHALATAIRRDKNDFAALRALGDELRTQALYLASNVYYERALRTRAGRERTEAREHVLRALAGNCSVLQQRQEAAKWLAQLRREFPGSSDDEGHSTRRSRSTRPADLPSAVRRTDVRRAGTSIPTPVRT